MTITHGTKSVKLFSTGPKIKHEVIKGYYLVCEDKQGNECRHWFSSTVDTSALDKVCDEHLGKHNNYNYWIDYCYGYDVNRRLAWMNLDCTERFI